MENSLDLCDSQRPLRYGRFSGTGHRMRVKDGSEIHTVNFELLEMLQWQAEAMLGGTKIRPVYLDKETRQRIAESVSQWWHEWAETGGLPRSWKTGTPIKTALARMAVKLLS